MTGPRYIAYLLRLWPSGKGELATWRASLEDPHTGERRGFADFDQVVLFLKAKMHLGGQMMSTDLPTLELQLITRDNWIDCINLTPTEEQQCMGFVAPNTFSLAQAYAEAWWHPYAVFVGFVMYGRWPETDIPATHEGARPGVDYLLRLMIDGRYQGKGYGRAVMERVIAQVSAQPRFQALELSYDAANRIAHNLYTSLGFQPTGRIVGGEIVAQLVR